LAQALELRDAAQAARHAACAFNYRFVPALALARALIARGELGELLHVRARFLLRTALAADDVPGWRRSPALAGSGVVGDLASHHVDLVRWLAGEPVRVQACTRSLRAGETEDVALALLELATGATVTLEASRAAGGHLLTSELEIDGREGTLAF